MTDKDRTEGKPYKSKGNRIHFSYIEGKKILNHIEYPETTEPPKELMKFYQVTQNSVNAITKGFLWAANPLTFNDPFDCPMQLWDGLLTKTFHEIIKKSLGVICFHELSVDDQDLLWGYYTDQKGFAIKFSSDKLIKQWGTPFKVEYQEINELDHFNPPQKIEDIFPMILRWSTQKKHIWKNENEWRFIFPLLKIDLSTVDTIESEREKKYDPQAIIEVILGLKFFNQTNIVEVSKNDSYYIIQGEQHKIQIELLSFLSYPSKISLKHMYMKEDELTITPRPCKIFNQNNGRFNIHYPLASKDEYMNALKRLEAFFDAPIGTAESEEANKLSNLIEEFENDHYPI